jgi:hypothetical protein
MWIYFDHFDLPPATARQMASSTLIYFDCFDPSPFPFVPWCLCVKQSTKMIGFTLIALIRPLQPPSKMASSTLIHLDWGSGLRLRPPCSKRSATVRRALPRSAFYAGGAAAEPSRGGAGGGTERGEPVQGALPHGAFTSCSHMIKLTPIHEPLPDRGRLQLPPAPCERQAPKRGEISEDCFDRFDSLNATRGGADSEMSRNAPRGSAHPNSAERHLHRSRSFNAHRIEAGASNSVGFTPPFSDEPCGVGAGGGPGKGRAFPFPVSGLRACRGRCWRWSGQRASSMKVL